MYKGLPPACSYKHPPVAEQWLALAVCQLAPGSRRCKAFGPYGGRRRSVPSSPWPINREQKQK